MPDLFTHPTTLYPFVKALALAAQNQADEDDGWTYKVHIVNTALALATIVVRDEHGLVVGYF